MQLIIIQQHVSKKIAVKYKTLPFYFFQYVIHYLYCF